MVWIIVLQTIGLSHSEIAGSRVICTWVICTYPALIAAYHVLHRLREPRHPPDALTCFRRLFLSSVRSSVSSATLYTHHSTLYKNFAHTFSCNQLLRFSSCMGKPTQNSVSSNLKSIYLQSCVTTCQRSLCRERPTCVGLRIGCAYPFRTTGGE